MRTSQHLGSREGSHRHLPSSASKPNLHVQRGRPVANVEALTNFAREQVCLNVFVCVGERYSCITSVTYSDSGREGEKPRPDLNSHLHAKNGCDRERPLSNTHLAFARSQMGNLPSLPSLPRTHSSTTDRRTASRSRKVRFAVFHKATLVNQPEMLITTRDRVRKGREGKEGE